nr:hypothetical protein GCM10017745_52270 [Saccharothrix mutabilis subsp. capreolus]
MTQENGQRVSIRELIRTHGTVKIGFDAEGRDHIANQGIRMSTTSPPTRSNRPRRQRKRPRSDRLGWPTLPEDSRHRMRVLGRRGARPPSAPTPKPAPGSIGEPIGGTANLGTCTRPAITGQAGTGTDQPVFRVGSPTGRYPPHQATTGHKDRPDQRQR